MMVWFMISMGIAVVAGSLPTIWPLLNKVSLEAMMRTLRSRVGTSKGNGDSAADSSSAGIEGKTEKTRQDSSDGVKGGDDNV